MKALPLFLAVTLPCAAQSVFTNGTTVHSGSGEDQKSNAYEFKGPYVLQWGLRDVPPSKRDDPYWKPTKDDEWKRHWLSVRVHDAATGKYLFSEMLSGRDNHVNVPSGGKHYVVVSGSSNVAWVLQGKEGRVEVTEKGPVLTTAPPPAAKPAEYQPIQPTRTNRRVNLEPVPEPKPSSVPGFPPGVEPAKKADAVLPPGMTKGGKP